MFFLYFLQPFCFLNPDRTDKMALSFQNSLFLLGCALAAVVLLHRPAEVESMQLEGANRSVDRQVDEEDYAVSPDLDAEGGVSFSEMDADALADKLEADDDDSEFAATGDDEADLDEEEEDGLQEGESEESSFLEVREEEAFPLLFVIAA